MAKDLILKALLIFTLNCNLYIDQIIEEMKEETFAPILNVKKYKTLVEAINYQNDVNQGLSSAILQMM